MPPRMAPRPVASLPESSQRRSLLGFGRGECDAEIDAGGGAEPDLDTGAARLERGLPLVGKALLDRRRMICSTVKPSSRPAMPSAIMLGRPSGMALAISFIGTSIDAGADSPRRIGGRSPPRGSLITRLCGPASISAPKRCGIEPVDADHEVEPVAAGTRPAVRRGATARPLRRRGFAGRRCGVSRPCQPAAQAASSRKLPVVSAPGAAAADDRDRRCCGPRLPWPFSPCIGAPVSRAARLQYVFNY